MLKVKVLGPGCANCKRLEQITRRVVEELAPEAEIVKVTDYQQIVDLGVVSMPGLVINGKVVSSGRVPSEAELTAWVQAALSTN